MSTDDTDLLRRVEGLRGQYLRRLAALDPTLRLLQQALERERAIGQMDGPALLVYVINLEARYGHPNPA